MWSVGWRRHVVRPITIFGSQGTMGRCFHHEVRLLAAVVGASMYVKYEYFANNETFIVRHSTEGFPAVCGTSANIPTHAMYFTNYFTWSSQPSQRYQ